MSFPRASDPPRPSEPVIRRPAFLAAVPEERDPRGASFPRGERRRPIPLGPDDAASEEEAGPPAVPEARAQAAASPAPAPLGPMEGGIDGAGGEMPPAPAAALHPLPAPKPEAPAPGGAGEAAPRVEAIPPPSQAPPAQSAGAEAADPAIAGRLGAAVEVLRLQSERLAEQARADALEIGFQVARRILEIELSTSPESLFGLVRSAVRRAGESRSLHVRLHPKDKELIEEHGGPGRIDPLAVAKIELVADPLLSRGDCVVEADFGTVDGTLESRLAELRRAIVSTFDEEPR